MPINGTEFDDQLFGTTGDDVINGYGGQDYIDGGEGADIVHAGLDNDLILGGIDHANDLYDGGEGDIDTVDYTYALAGIIVDLGAGTAQSRAANDAAGIGVDTLVSIEEIAGSSFDDILIGNPNSFNGFSGRDGNDTLTGGNLTDALNGGDGDDYISGGAGDDYLFGEDGSDVLIGGAGNDNIYAGGGYDEVDGGTGNDIIHINGGGTGVTVHAGAGLDTVVLDGSFDNTVSLATPGVQQNLTGSQWVVLYDVENLTGGYGDDFLYGNQFANVLDGGAGADFMAGGGGNDTYYVDDLGDTVFEEVGQGVDTVYTFGFYDYNTQRRSYVLPDNIENGVMYGSFFDQFIVGNELNNVLTAGFGDAFGGEGNDRLIGGEFSNLLDGGAGNDAMIGGAGDDIYVVDSVSDRVIENSGEGYDTVQASVNYALVRNLERLELVGTALNGSGNAEANAVVGNDLDNRLNGYAGDDELQGGAGNDWIDGGTGADHMIGGSGDDVYTVDNTGDLVSDMDGNDTIRSYISYSLDGNGDNVILIGSSAINATGDDHDNLLRGNAAANVITGNGGIDILYGEGGNDTLNGGAGSDRLQGGTGIDQLWGGAGADKFVFDDGDIFGATLGAADVIHDFSHAEGDRIYLNLMDANINTLEDDAFTFIGSAAFSGTAGELRVSQYGADMLVRGDIDGDGVADFMIIVSNTTSLVASDFIF